MFQEFKEFLTKTNALALAVGVIIGAAVGKVVGSLVADVLMPVIGLAVPGGTWRDLQIPLTRGPDGAVEAAINAGVFLGAILDFVIIGFVVFMITRALLKPAPAPPPPPTKECAACLETVPVKASKCRACGSAV